MVHLNDLPKKMVILHSYASLPEGIPWIHLEPY
jgi:hypothetical protein